jgi:hypothetical protein
VHAFHSICRLAIANFPYVLEEKRREAEKQAKKPKLIPRTTPISVTSPCIIRDLNILLLSGDFSDFVFEVEGKELRVHKPILFCTFPKFQEVEFVQV